MTLRNQGYLQIFLSVYWLLGWSSWFNILNSGCNGNFSYLLVLKNQASDVANWASKIWSCISKKPGLRSWHPGNQSRPQRFLCPFHNISWFRGFNLPKTSVFPLEHVIRGGTQVNTGCTWMWIRHIHFLHLCWCGSSFVCCCPMWKPDCCQVLVQQVIIEYNSFGMLNYRLWKPLGPSFLWPVTAPWGSSSLQIFALFGLWGEAWKEELDKTRKSKKPL